MTLPTDAQKEVWEDFEEASKKSVEDTEHLDGKERMFARADVVSEELGDDADDG